ncbi:MAG TPA: transketolase [Atribacterota bacterium]|nr:transketolase [Atribacterota bacterium]
MNKINELKQKAKIVRKGILECIGINKKGHVGGSMSLADLVTALYFYKMNHSCDNPENPDRDRLILSKGHSVLAQYAALAECGYFPKSILKTTKTFGSILQGHPEIRTPGIEANTGSLAQGLSVGVGIALGGKLDKRDYRVYVILGDGELNEGQVWEAITAASVYKLDNLVAIIDRNKLQASGPIKEIYDIGDIKSKFDAFGWKSFEIDGHNMKEIVEALDSVDEIKGTPSVIIAQTVKGKGISFAENVTGFHNAALTAEQFRKANFDIDNLEL